MFSGQYKGYIMIARNTFSIEFSVTLIYVFGATTTFANKSLKHQRINVELVHSVSADSRSVWLHLSSVPCRTVI